MTWQLGCVLVLALALSLGFGWYERSRPPARVLALVAALAALAAIGRVAFAAFPNVKPTTDIVLFSGYALGGPAGFAVGALAALVSNIFLGQGPWTPWQMAAWGLVGLGGAGLGRVLRGRTPGRLLLAVVCCAAGFAFGAIMDAYQWSLAAEHTLASYLAVSGTSLGFNIAHAAGNVVFALLLGPAFVRAVQRYRRRFEVRWRDAAPALASALAALAIGAGLGHAAVADAAAPADVAPTIARAVRYLNSVQNRDGGLGATHGDSSDPYFAEWAGLGLAAARRNPHDVEAGGNSIVDYLRSNIRSLEETQDYERLILVLRAAGARVRSFGGRDLVTRLRRRQHRDGSFDGLTDRTAFGILALRAAGLGRRSAPVRSAAEWLLRRANDDGGYGNAPGAPSDIDNSAAVVSGLGAAGRRGPVARRALRYVVRSQDRDGGFPLNRGGQSNSQSTSYAILALRALGRDPRRLRRSGRTPITFLRSMQAGDGSIRYSRQSAQTPVWVTAQALLGLEAKPLPLRPVPRRKARTAGGAKPAPGRRDDEPARDQEGGGDSAPEREPGASDADGSRSRDAGAAKPSRPRADASPSTGGAAAPDGRPGGDDAPADQEPAPDEPLAAETPLGTSESEIETVPDATATNAAKPGPAAGSGPDSGELALFAVVLVILTIAGLRFAWRRS